MVTQRRAPERLLGASRYRGMIERDGKSQVVLVPWTVQSPRAENVFALASVGLVAKQSPFSELLNSAENRGLHMAEIVHPRPYSGEFFTSFFPHFVTNDVELRCSGLGDSSLAPLPLNDLWCDHCQCHFHHFSCTAGLLSLNDGWCDH